MNVSGQKADICPPNLNLEDRKIDINNIYTQLEKIELVQNLTDKYNPIFIDKGIYITSNIKLPMELVNQIKLYQIVIKEIIDLHQSENLNKIDLLVLEKTYGQVIKVENVDNIVSYFKSSLLNEIIKRGD